MRSSRIFRKDLLAGFHVSIFFYNMFNDKLRVLFTDSIKAGWINTFFILLRRAVGI